MECGLPVLILACSCVFQLSYSQGAYRSDDSDADITLGGLFPVHARASDNTCGKIQDYGYQRLEAMVLAVRMVNEDPMLLPNLRLGFDLRDTCSQANNALQYSLDFVVGSDLEASDDINSTGTYSNTAAASGPGVSGVVGSASSTESIIAASLLRLFQTPQISYASTAVVLSDKTQFRYFLRTLPPDVFQARVMVELVVRYNWTYVIAMGSNDDYGRNGIATFVEELHSLQGNSSSRSVFCVIDDPILIDRHAEKPAFDNAVKKINEPWYQNSSVVVLFGQPDTIEGLLLAIDRYPNHRPLTFVVSDGAGDNLPIEYYAMAHGMISILPEYDNSQRFDEYYTSLKPSTNEESPWFTEKWEDTFNCSFDPPAHSNIAKCNESVQTLSSENYQQNSKVPFVMDAVFTFAHAIQQMLTSVCGSVTICDDVAIERYGRQVLSGEILLHYLLNTSFDGVSARIDFDQNGDQNGGYWVNNLQLTSQGGYEFVRVGEWSPATSLVMNDALVQWGPINTKKLPPLSFCSHSCSKGEYPVVVEGQSSCCWVCERCRSDREVSDGTECTTCQEGYSPNRDRSSCQENPLTYLRLSNPASVLIILASIAGLICTAFTTAAFIYFRKSKIVKASSRELSGIFLTGLFLCFIIPLFSIGHPFPVTCGISRFLFGFSFSLCYAALLVKTNRIHRIFNRTTKRPHMVSPKVQVLFTSILVFVQVVISVAWLVVEVPDTVLKYNHDTTELMCSDTPYVGAIVSLGYNIVLLLITTYFAFRTRNIPENFNETKFINITLYSVIIIWLAFIPTYIAISTVDLDHRFQTSSELFAILLSAFTTLGCLFFPKLYFLFTTMNKEFNKSSTGAPATKTDIFSIEKSPSTFITQTGKEESDFKLATLRRISCEATPTISDLSVKSTSVAPPSRPDTHQHNTGNRTMNNGVAKETNI